MTQLPGIKGKHRVILADPPWHFSVRSERGAGKSPQGHYDTMSVDDVCSLPVASIAADDCALFLWVTWPHIFAAQRVIEAWGFTYSGLAWEWLKYNEETDGFSFGTGYGTRKNLEPCLLARRGSPKIRSRSCRDFIMSPAREYSRKPDVQYERIERMFPGPYVELFARQRWPGWKAWGNETSKFSEVMA